MPMVKRLRIFCGLTLFSSAGGVQGPCATWGARLLTGPKGFLAPFFQFMPLTGEASTFGAPVPQLKPSIADYGYKPQRFSSFLPSQPLTKWRFLAASSLSCVLCNQEIVRHSSPMCAYPLGAWTWNRDLESMLNKLIQWLTIRFQTLLLHCLEKFPCHILA